MTVNEKAKLFYEIGEPYAGGLFEEPDKGLFYRYSLAQRRYLEALEPSYEAGEQLYPGKNRFFEVPLTVKPHFALTYLVVDWEGLEHKSAEAAALLWAFCEGSQNPGGWVHAAPNYKRILQEGLSSYRRRVEKCTNEEFREGLLHVLAGMEDYVRRGAGYVKAVGAPRVLVEALEWVPFEPARTLYEGIVAWNLIYHFDLADNLGRLDDGLAHLYAGEDATAWLHELFVNTDASGGWSCTVGDACPPITEQAVRAIRGMRRPLLELMVDENTPDSVWELAADAIADGSANPSFYNAGGIHDMLHTRFPHIPESELALFCGCGCTETNLQGLTRVGGIDDSLPLLGVFERVMHDKLRDCADFETFYEAVCAEIERAIDQQMTSVTGHYQYRATHLPSPVRTLFTDDCIDKETDFHAGGARYTWSLLSVGGTVNVIDSLLAVRELVFRRRMYTAEAFLEKLTAEDAALYAQLKECPCFGKDDPDADVLAADFAQRVYMRYQERPPVDFIEAFILSEHQYIRYWEQGHDIGPTPDGRRAGQPTADSIAALRGKATAGPTAMMKSASCLPQHLVEGISVLNLTLSEKFVGKALRGLVEGYFKLGGIQVQVTCTSTETLMHAMEHPEEHRDLIVRVGGFSEYFVFLPREIQEAIVQRNIHEAGG